MINDQVDILRDLTVHTCSGAVTGEDLLCAVKALYDDGPRRVPLFSRRPEEPVSLSLSGVDFSNQP